ncbi:serine/threonine protein kinase [Cystobacter ferrugineus]|uniref:Serine/threonine protein kinase n=1 Tax=Cystobacter ferrugineus TaxID=83449 RepID=A0A1L9BFV1_9BACT|nr:serine/threonine-protein kinase [Cystobacter ferrugineus]OJH41130.1 serine/threonine protein kinase [Cystobacter ferrugineus]
MAPVAARTPVPFGQYQLLERIAVGGMAELFLAHQSGPDGFDKPVVIKRIRSELSKQPAFVRMFLNEARLAAQLNHPNIVQIHDLGKVGDSYFIAMEYLFGRDTRKVVPMAESLGISFPMVYALKIASSVCEGLHYAHQKVDLYGSPLNIVHRDVTPENIFVCFDGTVKVLDFGIAKATNRAEQTTRAGELRGKLSYLSPEQCLGKPVDHRSDLFSLGAVLYEWLTGFQLFSGDSEVAVMRGIVEGKVYAPSYFRADIPEPVEAILMKALERDRDKRYPSAWHFQQDLDRFLNAYDFTPTHLHLSNFLKQLFLRELEEEQERLRSAPRTAQEQVPASDSPSGSEHVLPVPVSAAQLEQLEAMARRNNVPVTRMVGELLSAWLKYR